MVVSRDGFPYFCGELFEFFIVTGLVTEDLLIELFIYNTVLQAEHSRKLSVVATLTF